MPQPPSPPPLPPPMPPPPSKTQYSHNTGTAADLLSYETYQDPRSNKIKSTRVQAADEEWVVTATGGVIFYVKFGNNFPKKHFVTESKKPDGQVSVESKIIKTLGHRAVSATCFCGCPYNKHKNNGGYCKTCGQPICGSFGTPYGAIRSFKNKPTFDPLAGQKTTKNTCIVLSRVSREDFLKVVLQSILTHEKPPTWHRGNALAKNVNDEVELKWNFGGKYLGAVVVADTAKAASYWDQKQGCKVRARKTAMKALEHTWEVLHMEGTI
jgi:hypothetical protein